MRNDQYIKLQALSEKLADAVILDADPEFWTATGIKANELTQEQRGDAYWCRKLASSSLSVLTKVLVLANIVERQAAGKPTDDAKDDSYADLNKRIKAAEREAAKILERAHSRANESKH